MVERDMTQLLLSIQSIQCYFKSLKIFKNRTFSSMDCIRVWSIDPASLIWEDLALNPRLRMSTTPNPETLESPLPKIIGAVSPRDKTALKHLELELLKAAAHERVDRNEAKGLFGDRRRRWRLALVEERRTYGRVVATKVVAITETCREQNVLGNINVGENGL